MISSAPKKKRIAIIGAGFSGISAAAYAAQNGHEVHVYETHEQAGGRARQFKTEQGYVFDMGPSWYWMPDIIEQFFQDFHEKREEYFELKALNPQFEIIFSNQKIQVPEKLEDLKICFENLEKGAGNALGAFMKAAKFKYEIGMRDFVQKPSLSWSEFISPQAFKSAFKLDLLTNFRTYTARYFKNKHLQTLMEFPVIFLGASPKKIPALYSLMNYGGYVLGTHYPMGGFHRLVVAMQKVAEKQGATFHFNQKIEKINVVNQVAKSILIQGKELFFDEIIASCDYHHAEKLVPEKYRNYSEKYWKNKTFAPSCLIFYLGIKGKIDPLLHHTLFFENDLDQHLDAIYKDKKWPEKPLFYVCCPSKTDPGVAPEGNENLFLLMPTATGNYGEDVNFDFYLDQMLERIEKHTGTTDLKSRIEYKKVYSASNFREDYQAFEGNAYGLANTLAQTAVLKPKIINKKIRNLYYTGQLTVPGPGVPPSLISGKIIANFIQSKS